MVEQVTKILNSKSDIKMEIRQLANTRINVFSGFTNKQEIIVNLTSNTGTVYSVTYKLTNNIYYRYFIRFLRKNENSSR